MAKKEKKLKTKQENIDELDSRIAAFNDKTSALKNGNKNDKIVATILETKVENTLVKQKEELEGE
jgi:hypothetical protein